jgi:hypothetical protein
MVVTGNPNIKAARRLEMGKSLLVLCALVFVPASLRAQTSGDLAAKYLAVSAYEVRPGVLMTVKYAGDGQACEMTLEKRHSTSKDKDIDIGSNIPAKVIDELSDELAPEADRGPATSRYLSPDSYVAGGVSYIKRDFQNVSIEVHGDTSTSCDGGEKVVIIRWKKGACADAAIAQSPR